MCNRYLVGTLWYLSVQYLVCTYNGNIWAQGQIGCENTMYVHVVSYVVYLGIYNLYKLAYSKILGDPFAVDVNYNSL